MGCDGSLLKLAPQTMRVLHRRSKVHRGKISAVVCAGDDLVITGSEDYSIQIWSLYLEKLHHVSFHTGKVHALAMHRDVFLLSGGFDLTLSLYDVRWRMLCGEKVTKQASLQRASFSITSVFVPFLRCLYRRCGHRSPSVCARRWPPIRFPQSAAIGIMIWHG